MEAAQCGAAGQRDMIEHVHDIRTLTETQAELSAVIAEQRITIQRLEKTARVQGALYEIADLANGNLAMPEMMRRIHAIVESLMYARNLYIALYDAERQTRSYLYYADENGVPAIDATEQVPVAKLRNSLTMAVIRHARSAMGPSIELLKEFGLEVDATFGQQSLDWLGVPMIADGQACGAVVVQSYDAPNRYGEDDRTLLAFVAQHILIALRHRKTRVDLEACVDTRTRELAVAMGELRNEITVREKIEQQIAYEALHDPLTGLHNRNHFHEALERALHALRRGTTDPFAILFIDLDRFKVINDGIGHHAGDEVLKEAARRIAHFVHEQDLFVRIGGDEFAVLVQAPQGTDAICQLSRRIIDELSRPFQIEGDELFSSASIGIVFSHPRYTSAEQILRDAEVAMYRAKTHGRHRYEIFDERQHQRALHLLEMERDLRRAIQRMEFEPYFQPIVRLRDAQIVGYEALIRWRHPQRGVLLPAEFLDVAEECGLIEQMDWQVFEQTCRCIPLLGNPQAYVTINVSPNHFRTADLSERILDMLAAARLPPRRLRVELTEGALLENPELVSTTLDTLRRGGVVAVLDDFGTGYSSLSYLHRFPLHALKIDRSFVTPLHRNVPNGSSAIVRTVVALAQTMGMDVVAEGIETREQCDYLAKLGCMHGQGFLFSPARPISDWTRAGHDD